MNKIVYILLAILSFCVVSCDKIPENGDLDGNWQLLTIEEHNSGEVVSVKEQKVFWAVQLKLIAYKGADNSYLSRFVYDGDSLFLYNFYRHTRYEDYLLTDSSTTELEKLGIHGISGRFAVESLDKKRMVLNSNDSRLVFRKF